MILECYVCFVCVFVYVRGARKKPVEIENLIQFAICYVNYRSVGKVWKGSFSWIWGCNRNSVCVCVFWDDLYDFFFCGEVVVMFFWGVFGGVFLVFYFRCIFFFFLLFWIFPLFIFFIFIYFVYSFTFSSILPLFSSNFFLFPLCFTGLKIPIYSEEVFIHFFLSFLLFSWRELD